ncbi:MAG: metallopeptidase family protein [Planctomycetota bacterium]|nr:metallopeptidase family protein [Planctomycetota bacterium]
MIDDAERSRFDSITAEQVELLPYTIQLLLQETPLLVEDRPSDQLLEELGMSASQASELCGVYCGFGLTNRSVEDSMTEPETITIFREGILALVSERAGSDESIDDLLAREIRVTILHEIGHHFGLDEDDLDALGYA